MVTSNSFNYNIVRHGPLPLPRREREVMAFMYDQHVKPIVDSYDHWAQMKKDKEEAVAALRARPASSTEEIAAKNSQIVHIDVVVDCLRLAIKSACVAYQISKENEPRIVRFYNRVNEH